MNSDHFMLIVTIILASGFLASTALGVDAPAAWDTFADTWVATDALGRSLPTQEQAGPPRANKFVGLFYFLWLGQNGDQGPFDISKITKADPSAMTNPASPLWGPMYAPHHWGESIFDYYVGDDPAVLRKHAQMLADAGVDVIIFDVTNQLTYPTSWQALCGVFDQARRDGLKVPQIAFLCPFGDPAKVVGELWDQLYGKNLYPELWFRWQGKPLIIADPTLPNTPPDRKAKMRDFFTFRKPQPDYFKGPTGPDQWGWLEVFPQHVFMNASGKPEQMTVGVAQNAVDGKLGVLSNPQSYGRSFHNGKEPPADATDDTGRNFAEQWKRALEVDPPFIFITGWNEWIAGRFDAKAPFHGAGPVSFVDEFNQEFSRDIEPMKGGHGDAYYYQMIANIRRYKGVRAIPTIKPQPIQVDGRFDDWANVEPEFRDTIGDPVKRDHRGWGKDMHYTNQTGRNDIVAAKVSYDDTNIYFYIRTHETLSPYTDPNWMMLFIDSDATSKTGWLGYDFVVNRTGVEQENTAIQRHAGTGYNWTSAGTIAYRYSGNEMELAIPRNLLCPNGPPAYLDFKWGDNIQQTGDWSDFVLNGDVAPNDRFNYRAKFHP